jgi:hypothetical protein
LSYPLERGHYLPIDKLYTYTRAKTLMHKINETGNKTLFISISTTHNIQLQ